VSFYTGKLLRIDLRQGRSCVEPIRTDWTELYVGGKGILYRYLFDELAPGVAPLSEDNPFMVFTGPFAGTTAPACSRIVVGCKSPATGTILDSYVGGSFGPELKFAGYDGVILTGRWREPVVILISDSTVRFVPARPHYWGMRTSEIEEALRADFDAHAKVLSIGPAGESLLPWACVSTDQYHKAGRGGAGAVLGAKNVKAIAVRGTGAVEVPNARTFLSDMVRVHDRHLNSAENLWGYEEGTPFLVDAMAGAGALPTRNFTSGSFAGAGKINSAALLAKRVKNRSCTQCLIACRQFHAFKDFSTEGPEYETLALCGANCGIGDLDAVARFNLECDELAMDTISTGNVVALAMDLRERGVVDLGLRFGETAGYLDAPRLIAYRLGVGAQLALGARDLAYNWGRPELAAEVKNLEMPGYDPRGSFGMSLAYATSERGACHMRAYPIGEEILSGGLPQHSLSGKAAWIIGAQDFCSVSWTGIWCSNWATDPSQLASMFGHLWQRDEVEEGEVLRIGERIWNLGRLLNVREGYRGVEDTLPLRFLSESLVDGASAGKVIHEMALTDAVYEYYSLRGWDKHGVPTEAKLAEVGVDVRV